MNAIALSDPDWQNTFPHLVAPLQEEWFPGLLLRCDEANHWASGTTWGHLRQASGSTKFPLLPYLSVPSHRQVELIAEWLALPVQDVSATTYLPDLTRCYCLLHPLPC